jgi:hypothetical protein
MNDAAPLCACRIPAGTILSSGDAAGSTFRDDAASTVLLVRAAGRDAVGVRLGRRSYRSAGD